MGIKCPKCKADNPDTLKFCGECGTQLIPTEEISAPTETLEAAKEELTRGTTFASRYEIIEELGKGGMGKVYRVEDKKIKEEVALKLIKPDIASDKKTIERFSNELKMARKIAHRNVCKMYDLGEEKGTHYITMEYVPGEDLKSSIRRMGPLGAGKTIFIAKQVCEGLEEAHRLGVVHRDLKPQNIMIDKDGNARIMDFGIARSIAGKGITGAGVMIGTPEYMSPEQAEVKEVDQRSDIYSLGVILYEMVTGRVPFEGETPLGIAMKHKSEVPKDPKEINAQVTDDISRVILKCLEKDREKRYQSAGEVRSELSRIEKGIPTTEREIPKRKPITSREITVTFGLKKLFIPALVVIGLIVAGVIIWQLLPQKATVPIPSGKPSLAVVYFENNTGDENLEYLRSGLAEWLITDLSQSKFINVLSGDRIYGILRKLNLIEEKKYSSDDLSKVAREGGASHTMKGSFIKIGENFVITVMLQKPHTGEVISSREVRCEGERQIPEKVDELTRMIKVDLNLSPEQIAGDIDKEIGKITTSSPEAYKYYCEGFKYNWQGNYRQSIQLLEKAVNIDPDFATAHSVLGTVYNNLGYHSKMMEYYQKAIELKDRMSDRELYFIQGYFYRGLEKTYDKSIEAFKKLLQLYPDDMLGHRSLGFVYMRLEQWDKAIECFEVNIKNKVEAAWPYISAAEAYSRKGLYDKAEEILKDYLNIFPDIAMIHLELAYIYLCQGKLDLALTEADRALTLQPSYGDALWHKGYIYLCKGEFREAETEFQKLLESEEKTDNLAGRQGFVSLRLLQGRFEEAKSQATQGVELAEKLGEMGWKSFFHSYLSYVFLKERNFDRALQENDIALNIAVKEEFLNRQRDALLQGALIYLEMKSPEKAREAAKKLKEIIDSGMNQKLSRMYHFVTGMIELERKNLAQAIKNFKEALSLLAYQYLTNTEHALFIEPLALAYYRSGDLEKAYEEYDRIISLTGGRTFWGDIYTKSFYMLGKISEQKGWKGKAIEHYEKFLTLWKDADPGMAEVEEAKKRLAGLKN